MKLQVQQLMLKQVHIILRVKIPGEFSFILKFIILLKEHRCLKILLSVFADATQNWTPDSFADATVNDLKEQLGNDKVYLDFQVVLILLLLPSLLHKAIGKNLTCIFVDNGLLRKNEFAKVLESYLGLGS